MANSSCFPIFYDGDVSTLINPDVYSLHSSVLESKSNFFKDVCGHDGEPGRSSGMGMTRLTLVPSVAHGRGVLEVQTLQFYNQQLENALSDASVVWPEDLRKRWASVFRAFYDINPRIDSRDAESLTWEAEEIVQIAQVLRASSDALKGIETALLNFDQMTFHSIVTNPAIWAILGKKMRSSVLYQESVIHLVGRWNTFSETDMASLESCTRDLCEKKHQELVLKKKISECHILSYYPGNMHRGADGNLSCASYANDIYIWMAIAFFRQWFSHSIIDRRNHISADGGASFYRIIGTVDSYLNGQEQAYFNLVFPMSTRGRDVFEEKLRELKTEIRCLVSDLLVNQSRYSFAEVPYLTCCHVDDEDLPWGDEDEEENEEEEETAGEAAEEEEEEEEEDGHEKNDTDLETQDIVRHGSSSTIQTTETPDFNLGGGMYSAFAPVSQRSHTQTPFDSCTANNEFQQSGALWGGNVVDQMLNGYDSQFGWLVDVDI